MMYYINVWQMVNGTGIKVVLEKNIINILGRLKADFLMVKEPKLIQMGTIIQVNSVIDSHMFNGHTLTQVGKNIFENSSMMNFGVEKFIVKMEFSQYIDLKGNITNNNHHYFSE